MCFIRLYNGSNGLLLGSKKIYRIRVKIINGSAGAVLYCYMCYKDDSLAKISL